jgi:DNA-binding response OmpR family regulator
MNNRKKILVADDENVNLEFFNVMLSKLGFEVEEATNGVEALEKAKSFLPDLILLDNIMPQMTGWEVTKTLKSDPNFREIPIIMLSSLNDVKDKVAGFEAGVDDYITKPYNFSEVFARINAALRNRELYTQIAVREKRLMIAEELINDLKSNFSIIVGSIDEIEKETAGISSVKPLNEKIQSVRKHIANLDTRIEKTINEWDNLKKGEIGLSDLESQIRNFSHQE